MKIKISERLSKIFEGWKESEEKNERLSVLFAAIMSKRNELMDENEILQIELNHLKSNYKSINNNALNNVKENHNKYIIMNDESETNTIKSEDEDDSTKKDNRKKICLLNISDKSEVEKIIESWKNSNDIDEIKVIYNEKNNEYYLYIYFNKRIDKKN